MTHTVLIFIASFVSFWVGHAYAVWSRRRFIRSLMPATGEHTDFIEDDADECGCRRVRVRRGVRGGGVHETSFSGLEAPVRDE